MSTVRPVPPAQTLGLLGPWTMELFGNLGSRAPARLDVTGDIAADWLLGLDLHRYAINGISCGSFASLFVSVVAAAQQKS